MTVKEIQQYIENIDFTQEGAHIAMCTDAGACSGMNKPFLLKSLDGVVAKEVDVAQLTEDQIYILREIGELPPSFEETIKQVPDKDNTSVTKTTENPEDHMSKENEQILALQKQVAVMNIEKTLAKYNFDAEVEKGLASAMAELEDASGITKALDVLVEAVTVAVDKAKEDFANDKELLTKELRKQFEDESPLAKMLDVETGHAEVEEPKAMSLVQRTMATMDAEKAAKEIK